MKCPQCDEYETARRIITRAAAVLVKDRPHLAQCQTPDAVYHSTITPNQMGMIVELPMNVKVSKAHALMIEEQMHDAMEAILAKFFWAR